MPSKMEVMKDLLIFVGKFIYGCSDAIFYSIVPKPKKSVAGEIVLITGAGSGIGRLLALRFAHLGAILVLWDINPEGNQETCELAKKAGASRVYTYICNCSERQDIYRVADQVVSIYGGSAEEIKWEIWENFVKATDNMQRPADSTEKVKKEVGDVSILINNAGVVTGKEFLEIPDECVEKSFDVNSKAHIWTYKAFLPAMIANNHGHLVCISSSAGLVGVNKLSDYCASKFAAFGFAESIFLEMYAQGYTGIKTTIVCPFFIKTGMFEGCATESPFLLPILEPEYVVNKIISAILEEQVYLFLPRFLYFMLFLKSILPTKVGLVVCKYLKIFDVMNCFRGRLKKD